MKLPTNAKTIAAALLLTTAGCAAFDGTTAPLATYASDASAMSRTTAKPAAEWRRAGRDYYEEAPSWWPG